MTMSIDDGRWDGAMGTDDGMASKLFFPSLFEVCVHARSVESLSEGESLLEYVYSLHGPCRVHPRLPTGAEP